MLLALIVLGNECGSILDMALACFVFGKEKHFGGKENSKCTLEPIQFKTKTKQQIGKLKW
jgi:hypothetical protein